MANPQPNTREKTETFPPLQILVFGAGAIGTYIGGSLALQGSKVTFIERPQIAEGIMTRGMRLSFPSGEQRIPNPDIKESLEKALQQAPYDAAIFAMKSNDTRAALEIVAPYASKMPPVLCLQNGVENEAAIAEVLGIEKVIPGTVTSAVGRRDAGDIILERGRGVGLWSGHRLSIRLAETLTAAGLNAHLYPDAMSMKWSKMLTNMLGNTTSAILGMTPGEIFADPRLYQIEIQQLREALAVMDAQGIQVTSLPKVPTRWLAFAVRNLPLPFTRPILQQLVNSGRGAKMPSFFIDLHSGRGSSEVEYLNGAVVRFGEKWNVPTPIARTLTETLMALVRGELPVDTFERKPEKLLNLISKNNAHIS